MTSSFNVEDIRSAGLLGLISIIFIFLSIAVTVASSYGGAVLNLIGYIMILIALNKLSKAFNTPGIFRNAIYGVITDIVGSIVLIIALVLAFPSLLSSDSVYGESSMTTLIGLLVALWVVFYVFVVIAYRFLRNAYNQLADVSGVGDFRSAAKWYWYGALTAIVLVGVVLVIVGHVHAALGYNKLRRYGQ
ncbi:DUF996 domain-containing protein [Vulcanisaeta thermophila]|uniref:DUF996 domain-containing protein n=1 Tax=Vulcanisaeta thermophila TaxID=867917 RepID=UPI000853BE7B|nr:DUF996 domain-containing protein [Vulcanisaeta thermophila]